MKLKHLALAFVLALAVVSSAQAADKETQHRRHHG